MTSLFAPLYIGAKVVLFPNFDPKQVLRSIQKYRIVVFCGVPTLYNKLLTAPEVSKYDYSSLKYCISGSAPLPQELKKKFVKIFGCVLVEGYGLSEASPITHCNPLEGSEKSKIGSIGVPWPDTDAKIVDQEKVDRVLKPGEIGELVVSGPQVMKGYWNMPDETFSVLRDGWLYTGDLGKMDEDGYFYIIDRKKDLIKYKGHSIYPQELEEVLYEHSAVKSCCVVGKLDPAVGEVPKAFVVLSEGAKVTESELMNFVNVKVAYYKAIREVEFRKELPTNEVGKVIKRSLR
jgi:long-chain acyl-CoA synthetase